MDESKLKYIQNRIIDRLDEVKDSISETKYRLYVCMILECKDYKELLEMAELDLQIKLIKYMDEVKAKLSEYSTDIEDLEAVCNKTARASQMIVLSPKRKKVEITIEDINELLDDDEATEMMAMMLNKKIQEAPDEIEFDIDEDEISEFYVEEPDIEFEEDNNEVYDESEPKKLLKSVDLTSDDDDDLELDNDELDLDKDDEEIDINDDDLFINDDNNANDEDDSNIDEDEVFVEEDDTEEDEDNGIEFDINEDEMFAEDEDEDDEDSNNESNDTDMFDESVFEDEEDKEEDIDIEFDIDEKDIFDDDSADNSDSGIEFEDINPNDIFDDSYDDNEDENDSDIDFEIDESLSFDNDADDSNDDSNDDIEFDIDDDIFDDEEYDTDSKQVDKNYDSLRKSVEIPRKVNKDDLFNSGTETGRKTQDMLNVINKMIGKSNSIISKILENRGKNKK